MTKNIIGVDLGGTNMRAGKVSDGAIVKVDKRAVPKTTDPDLVINTVIESIKCVMDDSIAGIGIGIPGLVGTESGIVYDLVNIPSWKEVPLKEIIEDAFNLPVFITNDANCFAIGERYYGAGQKYDDFVGLITGTGLGGGIVKGGALIKDQNSGAGEFGMIPYLDSDYEHYCSGQFFERVYNKSGQELSDAATNGESEALEAFASYGKHLGLAIKTILFAVDPKAIVLGGSVSLSFKHYSEAMWEEVNTFPYSPTLKHLEIIPSDIEGIAILGAAALCLSNLCDHSV